MTYSLFFLKKKGNIFVFIITVITDSVTTEREEIQDDIYSMVKCLNFSFTIHNLPTGVRHIMTIFSNIYITLVIF